MSSEDVVLCFKANKKYMCSERLMQIKEEIEEELESRAEQRELTEEEGLINERRYGIKGVDW